MTEPEIDTAIDRAVRDLMSVDTDAAFRARVTARLERPVRRWGWGSLLAASAIAAALVVGMLWMRPTPAGLLEPAPVARVDGPAPRVAPQVEVAGVIRQPASQPAAVRRARTADMRDTTDSIPPGVLTAADVPAAASGPLIGIEPITLDPMATTPIATSEIEIAPLPAIVEVEISSLEPRPARN
jgi:hypothetical protein